MATTNNAINVSVGSAGKIIRSNGTVYVPSTATFADTYLASNLLYSNGANTVTGLATANSSVLTTDGSGVPGWSLLTGFANAPTNTNITSMTGLTGTLKAPTAILDANGNNVITFNSVASAVNFVTVNNNIAGSNPGLSVGGTDPSVNLTFLTKDGFVKIRDATATISGKLRFYDPTNLHFTGLSISNSQSTDVDFNLPAADGTANAPLITDGAGNLSFLSGAYTSFAGTIGFTGFSANPTGITALYKIIGKTCFIIIGMAPGTSNATGFTITGLPATSAAIQQYTPSFVGTDNSAAVTGINGHINSGTTTLILNLLGGNFTASGTKGFNGQFFYEIA